MATQPAPHLRPALVLTLPNPRALRLAAGRTALVVLPGWVPAPYLRQPVLIRGAPHRVGDKGAWRALAEEQAQGLVPSGEEWVAGDRYLGTATVVRVRTEGEGGGRLRLYLAEHRLLPGGPVEVRASGEGGVAEVGLSAEPGVLRLVNAGQGQGEQMNANRSVK